MYIPVPVLYSGRPNNLMLQSDHNRLAALPIIMFFAETTEDFL
jgi:hypothetical protein